MDKFEDKVSDKIKEQVAIVKSQKGRPRRKLTKGNVEFESVLATYDHREGQIKAMIEQIKSEQIHQMLVFHDQCYETTKIPFSRGWKDVYDEEMQRTWSLDDHVYKETSIESAKKDLDEWFGGVCESSRTA